MNERTNTLMNERTNEHTNERTNERSVRAYVRARVRAYLPPLYKLPPQVTGPAAWKLRQIPSGNRGTELEAHSNCDPPFRKLILVWCILLPPAPFSHLSPPLHLFSHFLSSWRACGAPFFLLGALRAPMYFYSASCVLYGALP